MTTTKMTECPAQYILRVKDIDTKQSNKSNNHEIRRYKWQDNM